MGTLDDCVHSSFKYVFIPMDPVSEVEERSFEGSEKAFKNIMRRHLSQTTLYADQRQKYKTDLRHTAESNAETERKRQLEAKKKESQEEKVVDVTEQKQAPDAQTPSDDPSETAMKHFDDEALENLTDVSGDNYQIIPLTLPTKKSNFEGVNCYIDNIGRVKDLATNARATRISGQDIRGDCFVSKTFDDEEDFKRIDFSTADFEGMLKDPVKSAGVWDQNNALRQILAGNTDKSAVMAAGTGANASPIDEVKCDGCGAVPSKEQKFSRCSKCHKSYYCSQACQKSDWRFHKRICAAPVNPA